MAVGAPIERGVEPDKTVTIASGGNNSTSFETSKFGWGTFQLPAAINGTEFTVQFSNDDTNFTDCPADAIGANPITCAADGTYFIPLAAFAARYARIVATNAQAAARTIALFLKS